VVEGHLSEGHLCVCMCVVCGGGGGEGGGHFFRERNVQVFCE
jgi:hypothetical protein